VTSYLSQLKSTEASRGRNASGALPPWRAATAAAADRGLDQQAYVAGDPARPVDRVLAGSGRHTEWGGVMTAAHNNPTPAVSRDLTTSVAQSHFSDAFGYGGHTERLGPFFGIQGAGIHVRR
jgi:hypothetical protein